VEKKNPLLQWTILLVEESACCRALRKRITACLMGGKGERAVQMRKKTERAGKEYIRSTKVRCVKGGKKGERRRKRRRERKYIHSGKKGEKRGSGHGTDLPRQSGGGETKLWPVSMEEEKRVPYPIFILEKKSSALLTG